jgi:hypothetical protein
MNHRGENTKKENEDFASEVGLCMYKINGGASAVSLFSHVSSGIWFCLHVMGHA